MFITRGGLGPRTNGPESLTKAHGWVNNKSNWLSNKREGGSFYQRLSRRAQHSFDVGLIAPAGEGNDAMLFGQIAGGRRDDGVLRDQQFSTRLNGEPDIFFADETNRR